jgi:transcriptional regulator GlxA family with amidase domain
MTTDLGDLAMSVAKVFAATPATSEAVFALLGDGLRAFDRNWEAAKESLQRALAMMEAERTVVGKIAPARGGLAPWQARKVEAFIDAEVDRPITTADLARQVRLSPQHFSRAFRQSFGTSPHAFVILRRIARAQHQMLTTKDPLSQIALDCGFADQAHFTRHFHGEIGAPPHAWRRQALGAASR